MGILTGLVRIAAALESLLLVVLSAGSLLVALHGGLLVMLHWDFGLNRLAFGHEWLLLLLTAES